MNHQVVGYIRVSSQGQNTARQLEGIELDKEFVDVMTGSTKERKNLIACMDYVREGDTLVVDSIDRLARNLRDLQDIVNSLIQKGVNVRFVTENLTFSGKDDPIANLTLQMMGAFAEFERKMIRSRQKEGVELARKSGKHVGRPTILNAFHEEHAEELQKKGFSIRKIAMTMKLSRNSVYKLLRLIPAKKG